MDQKNQASMSSLWGWSSGSESSFSDSGRYLKTSGTSVRYLNAIKISSKSCLVKGSSGSSSNSGVSIGAGNGGVPSLKRGWDDARGSTATDVPGISESFGEVVAGDVDSGTVVEGVSWSKGSQTKGWFEQSGVYINRFGFNQSAVWKLQLDSGKVTASWWLCHCFVMIVLHIRSIYIYRKKGFPDAAIYQRNFLIHIYISCGSKSAWIYILDQFLKAWWPQWSPCFRFFHPHPSMSILFHFDVRGPRSGRKVLHSQVSWIFFGIYILNLWADLNSNVNLLNIHIKDWRIIAYIKLSYPLNGIKYGIGIYIYIIFWYWIGISHVSFTYLSLEFLSGGPFTSSSLKPRSCIKPRKHSSCRQDRLAGCDRKGCTIYYIYIYWYIYIEKRDIYIYDVYTKNML